MTSARPSLAFPRDARVRASAEYARVFGDSRRVHGEGFRLHVRSASVSEPDARPRLGIAVSRKVSRRAVVRNRIKRCVRESFRHARGALPAADYVLVARPQAAGLTPEALRADLQRLWARAAALKPPAPDGTMPDAVPGVPARRVAES